MDNNLILSPGPHIHSGARTDRIMLTVLLALMPAAIMSVYIFGFRALMQYATCVGCCVVFEWISCKIMKRSNSVSDLSSALTGVLLAMNLPASAPWWIAATGSFVAVVIAKMVFGGLGSNVFNPALVARVFLLISFPAQMTLVSPLAHSAVDGISGATVLGGAKTYIQMNGGSIAGFDIPPLSSLFMGFSSGTLGETSTLLLLIGGLVLIVTKVITWHIPVAFIGTVFLLTFGHDITHPGTILPPLIQLCSGGLMLGAFFMATDYVTSPVYPKGKLIFGVGCGVLTVVIRIFGSYPEGVAFAILIMNAVTPLLDKYLRPKAYGEGKK